VKGGHPSQGLPGINRALTALQGPLRKQLDEQFVSDFVSETGTGS